ncbi:MAG: hypothetical protein H6Q90_1790 [Deltaproteobacteria bacterium]|nr:hypothetical protein [Deltaproteobacteria bacterium]
MSTPKAPFALAPSEQHVIMRPSGSLRGISITSGRLWLTSERLVFQPVVFWVFWLAPLVGLLLWLLARPHRLELPLRAITSHNRDTFGRNPNLLRLRTDGGVEHKFVIDDFTPFATALATQPAFVSQARAS